MLCTNSAHKHCIQSHAYGKHVVGEGCIYFFPELSYNPECFLCRSLHLLHYYVFRGFTNNFSVIPTFSVGMTEMQMTIFCDRILNHRKLY